MVPEILVMVGYHDSNNSKERGMATAREAVKVGNQLIEDRPRTENMPRDSTKL